MTFVPLTMEKKLNLRRQNSYLSKIVTACRVDQKIVKDGFLSRLLELNIRSQLEMDFIWEKRVGGRSRIGLVEEEEITRLNPQSEQKGRSNYMFKRLFYGGPSFEVLHEEYAKQGQIDDRAPVKASSSIYIDAPVERVWELLINLPDWPALDSSIRDMQLEAGANVDARFNFRLNNFPIKAKFAVINPDRELHWTGASLWFKAVDLHVLEPTHDGGTRLYIAESLAGVLAPLFMSSERLKVQHETWLTAFQRAAETGR